MDNIFEELEGKLVYVDGAKYRNMLEKYYGLTREETGIIGKVCKDKFMGYVLIILRTCTYQDGKVINVGPENDEPVALVLKKDKEVEFVVLDEI